MKKINGKDLIEILILIFRVRKVESFRDFYNHFLLYYGSKIILYYGSDIVKTINAEKAKQIKLKGKKLQNFDKNLNCDFQGKKS